MIAYCRKGQRNKIEHVISYLTIIFTYICMCEYFISTTYLSYDDPKALNGRGPLASGE